MTDSLRALDFYQIDAFATRVFEGNPAAVVLLDAWPDDATLAAIAAEHNLAETAFVVPTPDDPDHDFHIRWFTPTVEVPLCGHATLASAFVIFNQLGFDGDRIRLQSQSGVLTARRDGDGIVLNFPKQPIKAEPVSRDVLDALGGATPSETFGVVSRDTDIVVVFD